MREDRIDLTHSHRRRHGERPHVPRSQASLVDGCIRCRRPVQPLPMDTPVALVPPGGNDATLTSRNAQQGAVTTTAVGREGLHPCVPRCTSWSPSHPILQTSEAPTPLPLRPSLDAASAYICMKPSAAAAEFCGCTPRMSPGSYLRM